jgi:1,5-anhydro-D-fructose reductase (1,5-anhydro-D-mannitol-forming)
LNWLVIGIGDITSRRVIPAILREQRSRLYAVLTRNPEKAKPYNALALTDLDKALEDQRINAVYVASPVFLHAPQTMACLRSGRHVLCEKQMAMNYAEAKSMAEAARSAGRTLGVAYYRRTYPKVHRALELIGQGVIGRPVLAYITCHDWFTAEGGRRAWLLEPEKAGGGPLYDIGSHRIDLLNYFFGEPAVVRAVLSSAVHSSRVEDSATVVIEYESKVRGLVDVRWHSRVPRDEFRIIGTEGEMDLTPLNGPPLVSPAGREELPTDANVHFPCIKNFVDSVLDGVPLLSSGETALWTDWVTQKAMESANPAGDPHLLP